MPSSPSWLWIPSGTRSRERFILSCQNLFHNQVIINVYRLISEDNRQLCILQNHQVKCPLLICFQKQLDEMRETYSKVLKPQKNKRITAFLPWKKKVKRPEIAIQVSGIAIKTRKPSNKPAKCDFRMKNRTVTVALPRCNNVQTSNCYLTQV